MGTISSFIQFKEGKEKKIAPLYLFEGEDDFLIREAVNHLLAQLLDPAMRDFNYSKLTGDKTLKAVAVYALSLEIPMMAPVRVIYIEDAPKLPLEERDRLAGFIEKGLHKTVLILSSFTAPLQKSRSSLGKKLESVMKERGTHVHCVMAEREVEEWCVSSMRRLGYEMRQDAAYALRRRIGPDTWLIDQELKKLRAYCGTRRIISRQDIEAICTYTPQARMYQLTEYIIKGDIDDTLKIFYELTMHEEPNLGILNYINRFFLGVLEVKKAMKDFSSVKEVARVIKKSEYTVKKNLEIGSRLTDTLMQKVTELLNGADFGMKKGKNKRLLYETLLIHLCGLFKG